MTPRPRPRLRPAFPAAALCLAVAAGSGCTLSEQSQSDRAFRPDCALAPFLLSLAACGDDRPAAGAYAQDPVGFINAREAEARR